MFFHIIRYDWLLLKSSRTLFVSLILLIFFVGFAFWNGTTHVWFEEQITHAIRQTEAAIYTKTIQAVEDIEHGKPFTGPDWLDPSTPYAIGFNKGSRYAILPNEPLSVISFGQSDLMPYYHKVTASKRQALYHNEEIENPAILYNGNFDLAFVIVYLLPLLIIALSYSIVSAEKEQGTLALLFASETDFRQVVVDKYSFRFLLLTTTFMSLVLIGIMFSGINPASLGENLLLLFLMTCLYTGFWFSLSFLVNSYGRNSGYNSAVLLGAWLFFTLLIPAFLTVTATTLHPLPSRVLQITRSRDVSDAAAKAGTKQLDKYYNDHPELLPKGQKVDYKDFALASLRTQMEIDKAIQPIENTFTDQRRKQQNFISYYRFFSPAIFTQQVLNSIAGTGTERYSDFENQVNHFYKDFQGYFVQKVFKQEKMHPSDFAKIPAFSYTSPQSTLLTIPTISNLVFLFLLSAFCILLGLRKVEKVNLGIA